MSVKKKVVVVGGGFAGLNCVKALRSQRDVEITLIDRRNHHLFQPLLYQVAMAGLSPAEIAMPIRSILSGQENARVVQGTVKSVDFERRLVSTDYGKEEYDYLILACGVQHSYFGRDEWEPLAPGLKTIEQATEIRRRVLSAFEVAERIDDAAQIKKLLTFVVVGGGPTGVELAGSIGEMSRYTLARDFRNINPKQARVILIEAGPRILPMFPEELSTRAATDLEKIGVQVWTSTMVTNIDEDGVQMKGERIQSSTVLWAAGVEASPLGKICGFETDRQGRVMVKPDLSVERHSNVFVAGDQAHLKDKDGNLLPGVAPVALQQGKFLAKVIQADLNDKPRPEFKYYDKGQLATIGKSKAVAAVGGRHFTGFFAWIVWLVVHIYFLTGFKNRIFVVFNWALSYMTFRRGARLIVGESKRKSRDKS